nr:V-type proton ATPase subunit a1-like [Tanacetum cinerariifolium]
MPEFNNNIVVSYCDVYLSSVLSDKVLYSWGDNEDVRRKVIVISSCILEDIDYVTKIALLDAADKYVSVDFVLLEKVSGGCSSLSKSIDNFNRNICDLENCLFRNHLLEQTRSKILEICEAFGAKCYLVPEDLTKQSQITQEVLSQLFKLETTLDVGIRHKNAALHLVGFHLTLWMNIVRLNYPVNKIDVSGTFNVADLSLYVTDEEGIELEETENVQQDSRKNLF